jgi:uncharacterized protein YceK
MTRLVSLMVVLSMAGCATCKTSDSPEVCRTKQRDHSQPRALTALAGTSLFPSKRPQLPW